MYGHIDGCVCSMCVPARAQGIDKLPDAEKPAVAEHAWEPGGTPGNEHARCRHCGDMPFTAQHRPSMRLDDAKPEDRGAKRRGKRAA